MKKKLATLLLTSSMLATSILAPMTASADELTDNIQKQNQILDEIKAEVSSAQELLSIVQAEMASTEERANELLGQRVETQDEVDVLTEEIAKLQVIIEQREEQLKEQARSVQVNGSNTNYMNFIFASDSLTDLVARVDVVTTMVSANKSLVEQQIADQQAVEDKKVASEEKLTELIGMSTELEQLKADLYITQIEEESAIAALNAEQATVQADRDRFVAQKEAADRRAEEEAARIAQAQAAAVAAAQEAVRVLEEAEKNPVEVASTTYAPAAAPAANNTPAASAPAIVEQPAVEEVVEQPAVEEVVTQPVVEQAPAPSNSGNAVSEAYKYLGVPYVWGGKSPSGFDCSGLVYYVFMQAYGVNLGYNTIAQESAGTKISVSQAQAGDLLFWGPAGGTWHVAISLGNGAYIHAPYEGRTVEVNYTKYFTPDFAVRVN